MSITLPTDPKAIVAALEQLATDEAMGVEFHDDGHDTTSTFPNGSAAVSCTNCAERIAEMLEGYIVHIYGFPLTRSPHALTAQTAGGHDFAVVEYRYIVDPWVKNVESISARAVFDLENPRDHYQINRLYGDHALWERRDPWSKTYTHRATGLLLLDREVAEHERDDYERELCASYWVWLCRLRRENNGTEPSDAQKQAHPSGNALRKLRGIT